MAEPHAFLSYTRFDDDAHRGAISRLRVELERQVRVVTGNRAFEIWQDTDDLKLGAEWERRIRDALAASAFLIPVLTPSFFQSKACRAELSRFLDHERQGGRRERILPIYFVTSPLLEREEARANDTLARAIAARHRWDWRRYAMMSVGAVKVRQKVRELAVAIAERLQAHPAIGAEGTRGHPAPPPELAHQPDGKSPAVQVPPFDDASLTSGTVFRDIDAPWCPEMVVIPAGQFLMGSPVAEEGRFYNEGPQHEVTIARPFALGRYPVTFEEYDRFREATRRARLSDAGWGRGRRPVFNVSWEDAGAYCAWLAAETGKPYRLPSEAEWEYACRAGTTTAYWWGDSFDPTKANAYLKVGRTSEVGSHPDNPWGLFDMHGNVGEWCEDVWHDRYDGAPTDGSAWLQGGDSSRRVIRGGSWDVNPELARSAFRDRSGPGVRNVDLGFRVSRMLTP